MSYLMTRPIYSWTLKGSLYQWWQPQNFWSLLNLHSNLIILITGIYNFSNKESAIFQILLILKCRKFIPFILIFLSFLVQAKKNRAKSQNVFCIHIILRKPGEGLYFQIHNMWNFFSFFQSLIHKPIIKWFLA